MRMLSYSLVMAVLVTGCVPASKTETTSPAKEYTGGQEVASVAWMTDFEKAKKEAAERKVPILANFAGSDWCGWCMKLDREVFSRAEFKKYAKDNLVLFLADFPARETQPDEVKRQNKELASQYGIRGFPTVLLLGADGKVLARTGYRKGGAAKYVEHLKKVAGASRENKGSQTGRSR